VSHPSLFFSDMNGIPNAILKLQTGKCLFVGQIVEVTRVNFLPSYEVFSVSLMLGFQEVRAAFTWGQVRIAPLRADELEDPADASIALGAQSDSNLAEDVQNFGSDKTLLIPFQNENLCAYMESSTGARNVRAHL
jgi:hypothetical protein